MQSAQLVRPLVNEHFSGTLILLCVNSSLNLSHLYLYVEKMLKMLEMWEIWGPHSVAMNGTVFRDTTKYIQYDWVTIYQTTRRHIPEDNKLQ
jgi:hypothetical protein